MDNTSPAKNNNTPTTNPVTLITSPSFDLIHNQLAHPGKGMLQQMIAKQTVIGLQNVLREPKDFDCTACIQGKMTWAPFGSSHNIANE